MSAAAATATVITTPQAPGAPAARPAQGSVDPPVDPVSWKLYDETNATAAIVDAVNGAKHVVNVEYFAFVDAGKGAQLVTALEQAARRGVEVNVVTDFTSIGALPPGAWLRMRSRLEKVGGQVILTSRIPGDPRDDRHPALGHVDHRKIVTVDGKAAFVGGMNLVPITDNYQDSMVGVTQVAAARLAADQLDRWGRVGGRVTDRHRQVVSSALGSASPTTRDWRQLRVVVNAPEQKRFEITTEYRNLIKGAKRRLWISTPAISDRSIMADISEAARRGVDVRLITAEKPPLAPQIGWATRGHLLLLAQHGGVGYEVPGTTHRKAIVADDKAILSSYNLTQRSAKADHEIGIASANAGFVAAIAGVLQKDMDKSKIFDPTTWTGIARKAGTLFAKHVDY